MTAGLCVIVNWIRAAPATRTLSQFAAGRHTATVAARPSSAVCAPLLICHWVDYWSRPVGHLNNDSMQGQRHTPRPCIDQSPCQRPLRPAAAADHVDVSCNATSDVAGSVFWQSGRDTLKTRCGFRRALLLSRQRRSYYVCRHWLCQPPVCRLEFIFFCLESITIYRRKYSSLWRPAEPCWFTVRIVPSLAIVFIVVTTSYACWPIASRSRILLV